MEAPEMLEGAREEDSALLRRFVSGTASEQAESFLAIYARYRLTVREELERAGLTAQEAEQCVGAVFGRTLAGLRRAGDDGGPALRVRLVDAARRMADDPDTIEWSWSNPSDRTSTPGTSRPPM